MDFYPPKISEKFRAPESVGAAANANAVSTNATFVCGAVLRFSLRIDATTKRILEAKFKTNGCGFVIAAAETLAQKIKGQYLTELHNPDLQFLRLEIGEPAACRTHCFELALETLRSAFADFRLAQIEEFAGEKALICTCFGVAEDTIENLVKANSLDSVEDVTDLCNAGGGCGSCQPLIQEIIDSIGRERF